MFAPTTVFDKHHSQNNTTSQPPRRTSVPPPPPSSGTPPHWSSTWYTWPPRGTASQRGSAPTERASSCTRSGLWTRCPCTRGTTGALSVLPSPPSCVRRSRHAAAASRRAALRRASPRFASLRLATVARSSTTSPSSPSHVVSDLQLARVQKLCDADGWCNLSSIRCALVRPALQVRLPTSHSLSGTRQLAQPGQLGGVRHLGPAGDLGQDPAHTTR